MYAQICIFDDISVNGGAVGVPSAMMRQFGVLPKQLRKHSNLVNIRRTRYRNGFLIQHAAWCIMARHYWIHWIFVYSGCGMGRHGTLSLPSVCLRTTPTQ
jgi:hypothetical protein